MAFSSVLEFSQKLYLQLQLHTGILENPLLHLAAQLHNIRCRSAAPINHKSTMLF